MTDPEIQPQPAQQEAGDLKQETRFAAILENRRGKKLVTIKTTLPS